MVFDKDVLKMLVLFGGNMGLLELFVCCIVGDVGCYGFYVICVFLDVFVGKIDGFFVIVVVIVFYEG